jgi:hypothetical protein
LAQQTVVGGAEIVGPYGYCRGKMKCIKRLDTGIKIRLEAGSHIL